MATLCPTHTPAVQSHLWSPPDALCGAGFVIPLKTLKVVFHARPHSDTSASQHQAGTVEAKAEVSTGTSTVGAVVLAAAAAVGWRHGLRQRKVRHFSSVTCRAGEPGEGAGRLVPEDPKAPRPPAKGVPTGETPPDETDWEQSAPGALGDFDEDEDELAGSWESSWPEESDEMWEPRGRSKLEEEGPDWGVEASSDEDANAFAAPDRGAFDEQGPRWGAVRPGGEDLDDFFKPPNVGGPDEQEDDWPEDGEDDGDWENEGYGEMAGLGYQADEGMFGDLPGELDTSEGSIWEGLEGKDSSPASSKPPEIGGISAEELSLLYDDFEVTRPEQVLRAEPERQPPTQGFMPQEPVPRRQPLLRKVSQRRDLDTMEEREYVVMAEGIAVRTLPDERSPQTGEILYQGERFMAVEAVDGVGEDQRLYLRLPGGRGWVFDDSHLYPGLPSVRLLSRPGLEEEEDKEKKPLQRPVIAIVGRPNVGKSTLANRICDMVDLRGAMTWDSPGVTRDRAYTKAEHTDDQGVTHLFEVVDTGGLIFYDDPEVITFKDEIKHQCEIALREAVGAIFVVDGTVGPQEEDFQIARYLKQNYVSRGMKVVVAVAKCDRLETMDIIKADFWSLGLGEPIPVCSIHHRGIWEVTDKIVDRGYSGFFPTRERRQDAPDTFREDAINVAIVGAPNAGKSSLLNAFLGEERSIVSDEPHTTTDVVDAYMEGEDGKTYRFIDTAGIRKIKKIKPGTEYLAVNRAIKAIKRADVVLLVVDASEIMRGGGMGNAYWCPTAQHRKIARIIEEKGVSCVIVLSKWDAVMNKNIKTMRNFTEAVRTNLAGCGQWAEIVSCSAKTGQRLGRILEAMDKTLEAHQRRIPTPVLNEVVRDALMWKLPPAKSYNRKQGRIYYASQVSTDPPIFAFFCNHPKLFGPNWKAYLENKLRQDLRLYGTPFQMEFRKRTERRARSQMEQWLGPRLQPEPVWR